MSLEPGELESLRARLGREPNGVELGMVAAEWSEHCSYKSSKRHLRTLPTGGPLVVSGRGYDSGVLDAGGGYVVTAHIESHNHPSAVEPYGGAATGVGGVIRDILSAGTRPIAILDGLRFGDIRRDRHAAWLFRSAVSGIADYGNCIGVPTVGGEVGFDGCYSGYALVDVAAVGFGRREDLVQNRAAEGDAVVLLGGPTGRDGIGGAQFASDQLESEDRSAVQIPDPFAEKMIMEAVLEARRRGIIRAMKDLGGGGLSCAVSETADALGVGIEMDVDLVHTREGGMGPAEIMVSESQERMLLIVGDADVPELGRICSKLGVACSRIGAVRGDGMVRVMRGGRTVAEMPAAVVANADLLDLPAERPAYLDSLPSGDGPGPPGTCTEMLLRMLGLPNIASTEQVYRRYDHEVGIRTVIRPGRDAALLRLDNGRHLAVTIDGNPSQCHVDPYAGAMGCFEEACRNVVCTGARPAGMLDHLQFGSPRDPGIFWTFLESLRGIGDYARALGIPCIGGKVSLYNETPSGPIKPTPVVAVLGFADRPVLPQPVRDGDCLVLVGATRDEMGGSEYFEGVCGVTGGRCPSVDPAESRANMEAVLEAAGACRPRVIHDCSRGGLGVAVAELCMRAGTGCEASLGAVPGPELAADRTLFSESHCRYLLAVAGGDLAGTEAVLRRRGVPFGVLGRFGGDSIRFAGRAGEAADLRVDKAHRAWSGSLWEAAGRGQA